MTIVSDFLDILTELITGLLGIVTSTFSGVVEIFYVPGVEGGFTIYGVLLLFGLGLSFVMMALRFIRRLIGNRS